MSKLVASAAVAFLLALEAPTVAAELTVEVLLDCSATMNRPLADRRSRLGAAVDVVAALAATLPDDGSARLGLRTAGGAADLLVATDGCARTSLLAPPTGLDRPRLASALAALTAGGPAPLAAALSAVHTDLATATGPTLLLVVTDGLDACGGDVAAALTSLRRELPELSVQVVGLGLAAAAATTYRELGAFTEATTTLEMVAAVATTVGALTTLAVEAAPVTIELSGDALDPVGLASAELVGALTGFARPLTVAWPRLAGEAPGGFHDLVLTTASGELRLARLFVAGGEGLTLAVPAPGAARLELHSPLVTGGTPVGVTLHDAPPEAWLTVVAADAPSHELGERLPVPPGSSTLSAATLPIAGAAELRLHRQLAGPSSLVVASAPFMLTAGEPWLELRAASEPIETGDPLELLWAGPGAPGDLVTIVAADAEPEVVGPDPRPADAPFLDLWAPDAGCAYELRYVTRSAAIVVERLALAVVQAEAGLRARTPVATGAPVEVFWWGPGHELDFVTIVAPSAADDEYAALAPVDRGSQVVLAAPASTGEWEIRYLSGRDTRVLARLPLVVEAVAATLSAPDRVARGTRITVAWTGPAGRGDFIAVAPPEWPSTRQFDFAFASQGSPVDLAVPFRPGPVELRYVAGGSGTILAALPLTVE